MYKKSLENTISGEHEESKIIAAQLQKQMKKILKPYNKDLRMYLQCAEIPGWMQNAPSLPELHVREAGKKLFEEREINSFLVEGKMLPLEKMVILCSIMERCLLLSFTGGLTAHIPLQFTGQNDDLMEQLRMNIYFVLAVLDNEFNHALDRQRQPVEVVCSESLAMAAKEQYSMGESVDLSSLQALLEAAKYRGFRVSLAIQKRKAA